MRDRKEKVNVDYEGESAQASPYRLYRRSSIAGRRGAAIIELAVCLPLLVVATLGTIEACAMIF